MLPCKYCRSSQTTRKPIEQLCREYQYLIIEDFQKKVAQMNITQLKAYALLHNINLN